VFGRKKLEWSCFIESGAAWSPPKHALTFGRKFLFDFSWKFFFQKFVPEHLSYSQPIFIYKTKQNVDPNITSIVKPSHRLILVTMSMMKAPDLIIKVR
jgi:hypothetical protein